MATTTEKGFSLPTDTTAQDISTPDSSATDDRTEGSGGSSTHKLRHNAKSDAKKKKSEKKKKKKHGSSSVPASPSTLHILHEMIGVDNRVPSNRSVLDQSNNSSSWNGITEVPTTSRPIIMIYPTSKTFNK